MPGVKGIYKVKSAVFYGKHDLRLEERELPKVGANDVLIKVMACGVCGTDVHIYEGDKGAADTNPPTVLGHEFSGIVEAVGGCGYRSENRRSGLCRPQPAVREVLLL